MLQLRQPSIPEAVMRALDMKGDLPQDVAPGFDMSIQADDMRSPEYLYLRRTSRFLAGVSVAAVAAQFSSAGLRFASSTQRAICVVEGVWISNVAVANQTVGIRCTSLNPALLATAAQASSFLDDRMWSQTAPASLLEMATANQVGTLLTANSFIVNTVPGTTTFFPLNLVLTNKPMGALQSHLYVQQTAANVAMTVAFQWSERAALSSEIL